MASQCPFRLLRPLRRPCALRTSLAPPQRCPRKQQRGASVRRRRPGDPKIDPVASRLQPKVDQVFVPKTRIAVGVVFVSALAYSMLTTPIDRDSDDDDPDSPSSTNASSPNSSPPPAPPPSSADKLEAPNVADLDARRKRESGVTASSPMRLRMEAFVKEQQDAIVATLETLEPTARFQRDAWTRAAGGDGVSCVLQDGAVFEKAGVNTSVVYGTLPPAAVRKMRADHRALVADPDADGLAFFAAGLSVVLHPVSPLVPTVHLNYRYFETMDAKGEGQAWWFGGGTDLTPSYLFDEDAIHFHATVKGACDKHGREFYPRFKAWCDRYFRLPHRGEARGVGGVFFDDLDEVSTGRDREALFAFVRDCAAAFLPSYLPIVERRKQLPYGEEEKNWQQLRRGRYVEFNLVHDRGTAFGLNTPGARVESILMSLPLTARWQYMHEPGKASREERLMGVLREPREWV